MKNSIEDIFEKDFVEIIKRKLPYLFQIAEVESSRAGKIGMEVGSIREKVLIAMLIYKFGEPNVEIDIPITESEVDVKLFEKPLSIKTITGKSFGGVKIIWTVDTKKAREFRMNYNPLCDILLVKINWNDNGGLYLIPLTVQKDIFEKIGRDKYIRLPKPGTNPRGVEISKEALMNLVGHDETKAIEIKWDRIKIDYDPYKRWEYYWRDD